MTLLKDLYENAGEAIDELVDNVEYYAGNEDPMSDAELESHLKAILGVYYKLDPEDYILVNYQGA